MYKQFIFLLILFSINVFGQKNNNQELFSRSNLRFHLIDVESGLSNNFINTIEQDSLGFIWIGTADGLNKFDGNQFSNYTYENTPGLSDNNISKILYSKKHKGLVVSNDKGINLYVPKYEKFQNLTNDKLIKNHVVNDFEIDNNGNIIASTLREDEGLYVLNETVTPLSSFTKNHILSDTEISNTVFENDSTLWIGTFHSGVFKMNYKTKEIQQLVFNEDQLSPTINNIYIDNDKNVWIGSKNGLCVITSKKDTLFLNKSLDNYIGLSDNNILCFEEDEDNKIWIGTRNGGLNILNKSSFLSRKSDKIVEIFPPKSDGTSVFNRTVSSIKKDSNGNMWLGTSNGINYVNPKGEPIKILLNNNKNNSISHNRVASLAKSFNNKIWIGTDGGGLDLFDSKTGEITHITHKVNNPKSLSNNYIISVLEDSKGRVWAGTYQGGLNLVDPKKGTSKKYLPNLDVRVIFEDSKEQMWVGTNRGGLFKYDSVNNSFNYVTIFGNLDIRDIKEDQNNNLWLATFGDGIIWFDSENNDTLFYTTKNTKDLPTDVYFSLLPISNNEVLLGSRYHGLLRLNPTTKKIDAITTNEGLTSNTISSIIADNNDFIWIATTKGLNRINLESYSIVDLSGAINLKTKEFSIGSALKTKEGNLYFGSNKGLHIIYPDKIDTLEEEYPLVFKNVSIFNENISANSQNNDGTLDKSITFEDEIVFKHDQSLFSIEFGVLKYPFSNNVKYAYLLEGNQEDWIELNNNSKANFSNTPPGKYTLKVRAKLDTGRLITREMSLVVLPPFWRTWPAYTIYFILLSIIIISILKYYTDRIKLKNELLFEQKQRHLEHDLNEERMHFFTSFSHELKTPLTLILSPLEDLIDDIKTSKQVKTLKLIQKNANFLHASINKLLEFRKSELGLSNLSVQKIDMKELLNSVRDSFKGMALSKKIKFSLDLPKEEVVIWGDLEKLNIILNNLISNAFQHTETKGKITIKLQKDLNDIYLNIIDTGEGIEADDLPNIFNWYYKSGNMKRKKGSGVGLALTKSFVNLHGGSIIAKNNAKEGATFEVRIPIVQKDMNLIDLENNYKKSTSILQSKSSINSKTKEIKIEEKRDLILIIDDNEDIVNYLKNMLKTKYDLILAYDGEEGFEKAIKYIPTVIVSDIMMPRKSGIDLCDDLKNNQSTSHIPIILLTAKQGNESIKSGFLHGADAYISKPFDKSILLSRIQNLIDNRNKLKAYFTNKNVNVSILPEVNSKLLDKEKDFLKNLNIVIINNLKNEKINVTKIAEEIGMSRSTLFRKIKAITGKNINEYIRGVRIEKAVNLIENEGATISQASFEVGFNSVNYFRRVFKEELGILPSSLKKSTNQ